jgi:hypothetical protein
MHNLVKDKPTEPVNKKEWISLFFI